MRMSHNEEPPRGMGNAAARGECGEGGRAMRGECGGAGAAAAASCIACMPAGGALVDGAVAPAAAALAAGRGTRPAEPPANMVLAVVGVGAAPKEEEEEERGAVSELSPPEDDSADDGGVGCSKREVRGIANGDDAGRSSDRRSAAAGAGAPMTDGDEAAEEEEHEPDESRVVALDALDLRGDENIGTGGTTKPCVTRLAPAPPTPAVLTSESTQLAERLRVRPQSVVAMICAPLPSLSHAPLPTTRGGPIGAKPEGAEPGAEARRPEGTPGMAGARRRAPPPLEAASPLSVCASFIFCTAEFRIESTVSRSPAGIASICSGGMDSSLTTLRTCAICAHGRGARR